MELCGRLLDHIPGLECGRVSTVQYMIALCLGEIVCHESMNQLLALVQGRVLGEALLLITENSSYKG